MAEADRTDSEEQESIKRPWYRRGKVWAIIGGVWLALVVVGVLIAPPPEEETPSATGEDNRAKVAASAAEPPDSLFTEANIRSYRVYDDFIAAMGYSPSEFEERVSEREQDDRRGVYMKMTMRNGDEFTELNAEINYPPSETVGGIRSHIDEECGLELGERYQPQYDNIVGEASYSYMECKKDLGEGLPEKVIVSTRFNRNGVSNGVWVEFESQGFPEDASVLDAIVEIAQNWDAEIQRRAR